METKVIEIDDLSSKVLDYLSEILPDIEDDGYLGEQVLRKSLDTYRMVRNNVK